MKAASETNKTEMGRWEDINGDDPISRADQDELDRETTCRTLADICEGIGASEGRTIGLIGPWGCGKTSCLRVTRPMLEERGVRVIEFNPWLWSEAGDLVQSILDAIARTCGGVAELEPIAGKLARYARQLAGVNPWADAAGRLMKEWSEANGFDFDRGRMDTPEGLRDTIGETLRRWDSRLVVMVDDVDRLERKQLQDMLRAVRLAGNLPNVVYVVALDKATVARTLDEGGFQGVAYLEKILEVELPVPTLQREQKRRLIEQALGKVLGRRAGIHQREESATGLILDILEPLLQTPRDIKRYAMRAEAAMETVPDAVRRIDLLALEALRLKVPATVQVMERRIGSITVHDGLRVSSSGKDQAAEDAGKEMVEAAGEHRYVVEVFIKSYLPRVTMAERIGQPNWWHPIEKWRREGRIGELSILEAALGRRTTSELERANWTRQAFERLGSRSELSHFLDSLPRDRIQDVVEGLEHYSDEFTERQATEAIPVLMVLRAQVPQRPKKFHQVDTEMVFIRVVARLLEAMGQNTREERVGTLVQQIEFLGAQARFLGLLRHEDSMGRAPCPEERCDALEEQWLERLQATTAEALRSESELFTVARLARDTATRTGREWTVWNDPMLIRKIIHGGSGEILRTSTNIQDANAGETTAVRISLLQWPTLERIWGSTAEVMNAVKRAREAQPPPTQEEGACLDLAWEYWVGRSDDIFDGAETTRVNINIRFGKDLEAKITQLLQNGETREALCQKALRRGHGDPSVGPNRGLLPGVPKPSHPFEVQAVVREPQRQWAERVAGQNDVTVEDTWRVILAAGMDQLKRERD